MSPRPDESASLYGLDSEDALRALLAVDPESEAEEPPADPGPDEDAIE